MIRHGERGIGVVFLFVVAMVVVISVFMMMQAMTEKNQSQDIASTSLASMAGVVAESCVEEASYFCSFDLNHEKSKSAMFESLRTFVPGKDLGPTHAPEVQRGMPYHYSSKFNAAHTLSAYNDEGDFKVDPVEVGLLAQNPLPPESPWSNESYGKVGFSQRVQASQGGVNRGIHRIVQYQKSFKVLLLGEPYPFNNYSFIVKPRPSTPRNQQRFDLYFERYQELEGRYPNLPEFPIANASLGTHPYVSTTSPLRPDAMVIPALEPGAGDGDPLTLPTRLTAAFEAFRWSGVSKLDAMQEQDWIENKAYELLEDESTWRNKATHVLDNLSELVHLVSEDGVLNLNGVYFVRSGFALSHSFRGRGIIVTPAPDGILLRKLRKAGGVCADRLVLVALRGNITFHSSCSEAVQADLNAPRGTLEGFGGKEVEGSVFIEYLKPARNSAPGFAIKRPAGSAYEAWRPGRPLPASYASKLRVFFGPGYLRKEFWNQRADE